MKDIIALRIAFLEEWDEYLEKNLSKEVYEKVWRTAGGDVDFTTIANDPCLWLDAVEAFGKCLTQYC